LFAEIVILGFLAWRNLPRRSRQPLLGVGAIGVAVVAATFFWLAPAEVFSRLATLAHLPSKPEVSISSRIATSIDTLSILKDHPWIGSGAGSFEVIYPQYQTSPTDLRWDHAHNDYAEALAETGVVGGAIILAGLIVFFCLAFRDLPERIRHRSARIGIGAALGCCGIFVHSLVDFNFHIPANAAWFAVCLACSFCPFPLGRADG
jgi:O-antigen ligase